MNPPVDAQSTLPRSNKRRIGPIPPRDKHGKMLLVPNIGKKIKLNALNEPMRDKDGNPIEVEADLREEWEYKVYEPGCERFIKPEATKGLRLFEVDHDVEPIALVYARDQHDAVNVYKREFGIIRFGDKDPTVTPAE